jgi:hypothetical protein
MHGTYVVYTRHILKIGVPDESGRRAAQPEARPRFRRRVACSSLASSGLPGPGGLRSSTVTVTMTRTVAMLGHWQITDSDPHEENSGLKWENSKTHESRP